MNTDVATKKRKAEAAFDDMIPIIPTSVITHLILPFVRDRMTWNSISSASEELHIAAAKIMTPPWPEIKLNLGLDGTGCLKFSPCGSFLACGGYSAPFMLSICDRRRGWLARLEGHTSRVSHLSFSKDGNYLASAGADKSIRIWPTESFTRLPRQSCIILWGHRRSIKCLDFLPDNSNVLVCADTVEIKVWNVVSAVCTHHLDYNGWPSRSIQSMYSPPGGDEVHKCIFVTSTGSLIRTSWNDRSAPSITSASFDMPGLFQLQNSTFSPCGSLLAGVRGGRLGVSMDLTLFNITTMSVVRKLSIPQNMSSGPYNRLTFSPDGKTLVFYINCREIQIYEVPDLKIRRRLQGDTDIPRLTSSAVAFDLSSQSMAYAASYNYVRLQTL
jgi:WD40 repeat protein